MPAVLQALREKTAPHHQALEGVVNVMDPGLTREGYRQLLETFYGFYKPMEERLMQLPPAQREMLDFGNRHKCVRLEQDLQALGDSPDDIQKLPRCDELPPVDTLAKAAGCLYVMEGATLGGQVMTRHLSEHHDVTPGNGAAFFNGYGPESTGPMWKAYCAILVDVSASQDLEDEIVASAARTFECFANWLKRKLPA